MANPRGVQGTPIRRQPQTISFRATRNDRSNLRLLQRTALRHDLSASKSSVIRDCLDIAARHPDVLEERARSNARESELAEALEAMRQEVEREKRRADMAEKRSRKKDQVVARLLIHLPVVRDLAGAGSQHRSGITALDDLWLKCARSWKRVLERLHNAQENLAGDDGDGPPDPGGGPRLVDRVRAASTPTEAPRAR